MFIHSSSRFQKLSTNEINNLTYKEARQIANYARTLINKRIDYLISRGLGDANENIFGVEYDFRKKSYRIPTIPQNEDISFYKNFIKEMKYNYQETSVQTAIEKLYNDVEINITLKKIKYLYIKEGGHTGSGSEIQTFVDSEIGGDWDIYWNSFLPKEVIETLLNSNAYSTLHKIVKEL